MQILNYFENLLLCTSDKETFNFILFQRTDVNLREVWVSGPETSGKFGKKESRTSWKNSKP